MPLYTYMTNKIEKANNTLRLQFTLEQCGVRGVNHPHSQKSA